jgi:hypothetical protein
MRRPSARTFDEGIRIEPRNAVADYWNVQRPDRANHRVKMAHSLSAHRIHLERGGGRRLSEREGGGTGAVWPRE